MPLHADFKKIKANFISEHGQEKGEEMFRAYLTKHKLDETKPFKGKKEEKEMMKTMDNFEFKTSLENIEIKEEEGIVSGFIATTHPDNSYDPTSGKKGDILKKSALQKVVDKINSSNPQDRFVKGVSLAHDWIKERNIHKPVAGAVIKAELREMEGKNPHEIDGKHYGVYVDDLLDKTLKTTDINGNLIDYSTVSYRIKNGFYPGFSIEFQDTKGELKEINGEVYRIVHDFNYLGHGLGGLRDTANAFAGVHDFKTTNGVKIMQTQNEDNVPNAEIKTQGEEFKEVKMSNEQYALYQKMEMKQKENLESDRINKIVETKLAELKTQMSFANTPLKNTNVDIPVGNVEVKEISNYFKALESGSPVEHLRSANALVNKFPSIYHRSFQSGGLIEARTTPKLWNVDNTGTKIECKTGDFRSFINGNVETKLTTTTNDETTYYQAAAELNDVYDPVIYSHINDQITTYNMLLKDDYSSRAKIQFRAITSGPTAALYAESISDTWTSTSSTRVKFELDWAYVRSIVEVTGQMIADAQGQGGLGDVFGEEVRRAAIEVVRLVNLNLLTGASATYDGEAGSTNGRMLGFLHLLDTDTADNLYGKSRNTFATLRSGGNDAMGSVNITFQKLRSIITTVEENGANRRDLVFVFSPQQRDKYLQVLQSMGQMPQPITPIAGFNTENYGFDGIPIWVDKDMTAGNIFLLDRENTRLAIKVAPTLTEFGVAQDSRKAFIKMYFNLYSRTPNHNYLLTGLAT